MILPMGNLSTNGFVVYFQNADDVGSKKLFHENSLSWESNPVYILWSEFLCSWCKIEEIIACEF